MDSGEQDGCFEEMPRKMHGAMLSFDILVLIDACLGSRLLGRA